MANQSSKPQKVSSENYSIDDITRLERESLQKANKAISSIENAMAVWDAAKVKPPDLQARITKLKYFHNALSSWERKMLKAMASKQDTTERVARLREFSDICYTYAGG